MDSPEDAKEKTGEGKTRRLQEALAAHLRHVGRVYPAAGGRRVVLPTDDAPWRRGRPIDEALTGSPHLGLKRPPADGPQLDPAERFWRVLRRRATHNRPFDTPARATSKRCGHASDP